MKVRRRDLFAIGVALALIAGSAVPSLALTACKATVHKPTGVIRVNASDVSGVLMWGEAAGMETNAFTNAGTCLDGTKARKCEIGAPGTPEQVTPPQLCRIYLADGLETCSALVLGCTPGVREAVPGPDGPEGPEGPEGPAGPPFAVSYETCTGTSASGMGASSACTATCPMGSKIISGVCANNTATPQFVNGLISDPGTNTIWSCTVKNQNSASGAIAALGTAICAPQ
jgi:hypothetical protein